MKAKFIVFEGINNAGKKTHIKILTDRLRDFGIGVVVISFPDYDNDIARMTKKIEMNSFTSSLLFAADRSFHQERIMALLERGTVVIADRYCYSNFAYKSVGGVPIDWLKEIEKPVIKPDMVILIDLPTEASIKRVQQASIEEFTKKEMLTELEKQREFTEKVRQEYLNLARCDKETKWFVIDGTKELKDNLQDIWNIVSKEIEL